MAEAAAAQLRLPTAEVEAILEEMYEIHLLQRLEMELASGMIDTYIVNDNSAYIPFMLISRCLIEKDMAFYIQWIDRKSALLRKRRQGQEKERRP